MSITSIKPILSVAVLAISGFAVANESPKLGTIKPRQGLTFDVGAKRAVSYFTRENNSCKLVVTIAETPTSHDAQSFAASRFETTIGAGRSTRFDPKEGKLIEFACHANAESMSVSSVERLAQNATR